MSKHIVEDNPNLAGSYAKKNTTDIPKNLILYGPPGTGKTYQAIQYAVALVEKKSFQTIQEEKFTQIHLRFQQYIETQQIAFVTLHPAFGYEDFVQGIKPNVQANTLLFEKKEGVFKKIADRAKKNIDQFLSKSTAHTSLPFEDMLNMVLSQKIDADTEEIEFALDISHRIYKSIVIFDITEQALIYRRKTKNDIIKTEERSLFFNKLKDLYTGKDIKEAINEKYYQVVVEAVKTFENNLTIQEDTQTELRNYVIILDEINRANISAVFGELITLIEEDKRYKASYELSVELAGGELFTVPSNLYIIGTMNTADKSIALLDIALRRRFQFRGLFPDESLVQDKTLQNLMKKLNNAIFLEKKSPDFLIGHSFFMNNTAQDLPLIFNTQIVPLLEEYFPNRRDKVLKILKEIGLPFEEIQYQIQILPHKVGF